MSYSNVPRLDINRPDIIAELKSAFESYEQALMANDPETLVNWFWDSPHAIRYGVIENLYGYDEISAFRRKRAEEGGAPKRTVSRTTITTYGTNFGTTHLEYVRESSNRRGRQSQTWMRTHLGWRIVAAHVSLEADTDA